MGALDGTKRLALQAKIAATGVGSPERAQLLIELDALDRPKTPLSTTAAAEYAKMDLVKLSAMNDVSKRETISGSVSDRTPAFEQNWDRMEKLIKTNPTAARGMIHAYESNSGSFGRHLRNMAVTMNRDPEFASAMLKRVEAHPDQAGPLFEEYERNPSAFVAAQKAALKAPAPSATKPGAADVAVDAAGAPPAPKDRPKAPAAGKVGYSRQAELERIRREAGGGDDEEVLQSDGTWAKGATPPADAPAHYTTAEAKEKFASFLADPKNQQFSTLAKKHRLDGPIAAKFDKDPDAVNDIVANPPILADYMDQMKKLDKLDPKSEAYTQARADFIKKFGGGAESEMTLAGAFGSLKEVLGSLKDVPFIGPMVSGLMEGAEKLFGIIGRLFGGSGAGGGAAQITAANPSNAPVVKMIHQMKAGGFDKQEMTQLDQQLQHSLTSTRTQEREDTAEFVREKLAKQGITDPAQQQEYIKSMQRGDIGFSMIQVTKQKDAKTGAETEVVGAKFEAQNLDGFLTVLKPKIDAAPNTPSQKLTVGGTEQVIDPRRVPLAPNDPGYQQQA